VFLHSARCDPWGIGWKGPDNASAHGPVISFDLRPAHPQLEPMRFSRSGATLTAELHLPTDRPGIFLRCRLDTSSLDLARLQRQLHRSGNHERCAWVIAGMVLLLAACGWVTGGNEGARWAVTGATRVSGGSGFSSDLMQRWFGARPLRPADTPALFNILVGICHRAGLRRLPELYWLAAPNSMNAYALGDASGSAITLTEGLLRSMSLDEIAGILAHEVAHISNNDAWTMAWATTLHRAITLTSMIGLAPALHHAHAGNGPFAKLLASAPVISELLCLALSRIRELDADAAALELMDNSVAFVAALNKLERHHTGAGPMAAHDDDVTRLLRSHPPTSERVGTLQRLAH
jgi:heat shock protein HtpX